MTPFSPPSPSSRSRHGTWWTLLCVLLFGVFLLRTGTGGSPPPRPDPSATARPVAAGPQPSAAAALPHSPPRRIIVPSLGVDAPITKVGLAGDGRIKAPPPADGGLTGWYTGAVSPGERGTSVVVGHVDNAAGPAVFHLLGTLARGSRVEVRRADGRTAVFSVYAVESHRQRKFPAERVYRDAPGPELRLITCGGRYTKGTGYESNVVVFARLVAIR
jgi:hypothetical protein